MYYTFRGNIEDLIEMLFSDTPDTKHDKYTCETHNVCTGLPDISDVIFNRPATIIKWTDGTKTVVKCGSDDVYDKEKGFAMALLKKIFGNNGNYNEIFKRWCWDK